MSKVFISYSHDSDEHREFVRGISDRLRSEGLDCRIDLYINGFPPEGWQRWMEDRIEDADFVLLVCTPAYLKRYRGRKTEGGKGVTFEGVVISQILYEHYYRNTKFIPVIPANGSLDQIPVPLKPYTTYRLPDDYDRLYRVLTGQAEYLMPDLGEIRVLPAAGTQTSAKRIHIDRLPTVAGEFFGREQELQLLDDALAGDDTRIIQFVAAGGTGKTKLLRHWLNRHEDDIPDRIVWSFYSQGTSEDKQVSASPLFTEVFKAFGVDQAPFKTEEEKADALAEQLIERRCLLVLDGLEPMQHGGRGMDGRLKDRAMVRLLKKLAQQHSGLCIITTRIAVHDIRDQAHVLRHPLDDLATADAVRLLQSLGVQGSVKELDTAVEEVEGHALTLHLLGNAIATYLDGDIRKRDTLEVLIDDFDEQGRHAFKVMQAYQHWLADDDGKPMPELQLLYLLGLFDHPIETQVLEVLWREQIPALTHGIPIQAWKIAIRDLRDRHHLLSRHQDRPDLLDCHPLIREYFGRQLQRQQPEAWRQAHERLYDYYRALPEKELPDTLEEMQPLFNAVAHGCAAGLHQQALYEVYRPRVYRDNDEQYIVKKLGAFSDDLAAVAHFFARPWHGPAVGLGEAEKAGVLSWAGYGLRALGRLHEALEPMRANVEMSVQQENWLESASGASNLSQLQLTLGDVEQAVQSGQCSLDYANRSGNWYWRMVTRTTHADALHQSGEVETALTLFCRAEQLEREYLPAHPHLFSLWGFRYCDLLLAQGATAEVLLRAEYGLRIAKHSGDLLSIALDNLTLGCAHLQQPDNREMQQAWDWLDQAVARFRAAARQDYLPRSLLARTMFYRHTGDFTRARRDLQEVFDIAEPSGMRLHLTDYHLEMARLSLAEGHTDEARQHADSAEELIEATGYKRRLPELADLRKKDRRRFNACFPRTEETVDPEGGK